MRSQKHPTSAPVLYRLEYIRERNSAGAVLRLPTLKGEIVKWKGEGKQVVSDCSVWD